MFGLGAPELLIILVALLVLFGSTKIPQLFRSLGQAKSEFEAGAREGGAKPAIDPAATADESAKKD
jgi:sec-independent protein translocase protein TatA